MIGTFSEQTMVACSYHDEFLGLLTIYLILLSIYKVNPNLLGSVYIYSNCLGALDKVKNLPPYRIPSKCRHSDVLKNIMIHCSAMTFDCLFSHVPAHQDNREDFENLSRQSQLICAADFGTKRVLLSQNPDNLPMQQALPLCCKPSDQPRDAARREECSGLDEKSLTTFCRCDGRAKGIAREHQHGFL